MPYDVPILLSINKYLDAELWKFDGNTRVLCNMSASVVATPIRSHLKHRMHAAGDLEDLGQRRAPRDTEREDCRTAETTLIETGY